MGAANFQTTATGKSMGEAFGKAVRQALHEYGHGGYTGTIAEKHDVTDVTRYCPGKTRATKLKWIDTLWEQIWDLEQYEYSEAAERAKLAKKIAKQPAYVVQLAPLLRNKWGAAASIKLGLVRTTRYAPTVKKTVACYETEYVFFGMASE